MCSNFFFLPFFFISLIPSVPMYCLFFNKTLKTIKQTWLAEKLGKSYNMVNSYVQNRRQPSLQDLFSIAKILDVSVTELIMKEEKKIYPNPDLFHMV